MPRPSSLKDNRKPVGWVAAASPTAAGDQELSSRGELLTIHIGLGAGVTALVLVIAVAAGFVFARFSKPAPAVVINAPAVAATVIPQATASKSLGMNRAADGQLAPGMVLDVGESGHPLLNASAPEIIGTLLDGAPASLSSYVGRPLVVNFWATWCPPCRMEMPWLERAYEANKAKGLVLLGVNAGEKVAPESALSLVRDFVANAGMTFPIFMPTDAYQAQVDYQVYGLPSTYFIGRDGKVSDVIRGAFPNQATLDAHLAAYWRAWDTSAR